MDAERHVGGILDAEILMATQDKIVPVGEWLPDLPQNGNPGINTAMNVLPLTEQSYSPVPSFLRGATTALPSAPLGAFSTKDNSENPAVYVGTASDLFILDNGTKPNFKKVSSSAGAYSVPQGSAWSFDTFGADVYASNGDDPIQSAPTANDSTNFSVVDTNAPKAKIIATIQPGFLLCGNINDVTVGIQPQGIRWSALGAASNGNWPLIGSQAAITAQSDWQAVQGAKGALQAIAADLPTCNAALFFENAIFGMLYTGDSAIFDIQPIEKKRGTVASRSVVQVGQMVYYLAPDGFYAFNASSSEPIGKGKIDTTFYRLADPNYLSQVQGVADPLNGLIYWAFAGPGNSNGIPNFVIVFNPVMNRWSLIDGFEGSNPMIGLTFGTSLDAIDALGFNIDTLPFSLDGVQLSGGNAVLAAFDASNFFGYFTGPNLPYQIETTESQLIAGRKSRVNGVRPLVEGDNPTVAVGMRDLLAGPSLYGPSNPIKADGVAPARGEGRYARAMLTGALGNVATQIVGVEAYYSPAGAR